jgi:hypothetical protein
VLGPGFTSRGPVRLVRARIGADLDCTGALFDHHEGDALNADGSQIEGSVFLRGKKSGPSFTCIGTARFVSVSIGDSVLVQDASLDSRDRKYALSLALATIRRQLTIKNFSKFEGRLNLSGAQAYSLDDDPREQFPPRDMILNGFSYVHFSGKAPLDVDLRLAWLARQSPSAYGQDFWPQPYGQLAKVLSATGHESEAREVLVEKERQQGRVGVALARRQGRWMRARFLWLGDQLMRRLVGYGYRPQRSVFLMLAILVSTSLFLIRPGKRATWHLRRHLYWFRRIGLQRLRRSRSILLSRGAGPLQGRTTRLFILSLTRSIFSCLLSTWDRRILGGRRPRGGRWAG